MSQFDPSPEPDSFGHHFLVGLQKSPVLTDHDKRLLSVLRPAGIVLFRDNFAHELEYPRWLALHERQLREAREAIGRERILVCIDHEGGAVLRTPQPVTRFAAAAEWAEHAESVGRAMGLELASLGVNVDFAPVADIHLHPHNPVIGERALGTTPTSVAAASVAFLRGLQSSGVLGCAKHFPGHGATDTDSHAELPVLDEPLEVLRRRELVPFAALVEAGVPMVMTAHIHFPQVAPDLPATLSPRFLREILRAELGFEGVVVSDDVGMRAVAERFARPETAAEALVAGCDLIAVCAHLADTNLARDLAGGIVSAWKQGVLKEPLLAASHRRVARLWDAAPQHAVAQLSEAVFERHRGLAPILS